MDLSHDSASPRVELVTWSSFRVLVERNPGTYRCSAAPCDISVTQDGGPTFILIQPLSAGKTFSPRLSQGLNAAGARCFSARHIFTVAVFSVSIRDRLVCLRRCSSTRKARTSITRPLSTQGNCFVFFESQELQRTGDVVIRTTRVLSEPGGLDLSCVLKLHPERRTARHGRTAVGAASSCGCF